MKAWKVLLFIISVIGLLTVISLLIPAEEWEVGPLKLKFPKPESILVREEEEYIDPEEIIKALELEARAIDSTYRSLEDTVAYYKKAMAMPTKFCFPNDDYTYYDRFFAALESARSQGRTIRIMHYGDSQIELDRISSNIREYFQSHFGGGGPGLLPLVTSVGSPTIYQSYSGNSTQYALYGNGSRNSERNYGVMAKSFRVYGNNSFYASSPKKKVTSTRQKSYNKIQLFCTPRSENFKATLVNKAQGLQLERLADSSGAQLLTFHLDTAVSNFTLKLSGEADIYGVAVDNGYGVAVDNMPMRGASGTFFSQMSDSLLAHYFELIDVGMIIMQYGGNSVPSIYSEKSVDRYVESIGREIRFMRRMRPGVPILFIGPSDMSTRINGVMSTYKWLPMLVEKLKATVTANGAAFWDLYHVMGGKNSMISWVKKGWAGGDYVHFSSQGAQQVGQVLTQSFQSMYDFYQLRKTNPDIDFNVIWSKIPQVTSDTLNAQPTAPVLSAPAAKPDAAPVKKLQPAQKQVPVQQQQPANVEATIPQTISVNKQQNIHSPTSDTTAR